jgi:RNA polymerase sigma factor (sigma-70 family)
LYSWTRKFQAYVSSVNSRCQTPKKMDKWIEVQQVDTTDAMTWALFKSGDDESLNVLLSRYFRPLLHYGSKFSKDRSLVEDVIQDLFLDFLEKRTHLGSPVSVKNYLFKCLRNNLIRAVKETLVRVEMPEKEDLFVDFENIEKFLVGLDESTELTSKITRFFSFLTKRQKEVLFLRYYENLDNDEIAEMMGISKQSVSNLLLKSVNVLRENWIFIPLLFAGKSLFFNNL